MVGYMVKKWGYFFIMLESKLWYNKTENKNVKGAKKLGFIKTCDH